MVSVDRECEACVGVDVGVEEAGKRGGEGDGSTPPATPCRSGDGVSIQMK